MEPIEYLRVFKRWWKLIAAVVVLAVAVAWLTTPARPGPSVSTFRASYTLLRDDDPNGIRQSAGTVALFVTAGEVPGRVAERLAFDGEGAVLAAEVTAEANEQLGTVVITAENRDGLRAAELANAFGEETLAYLTEQVQLEQQRQTDILVARLDDLETRVADLDAEVDDAQGSQVALLTAQRDAQVRQYGVAYEQFQQLAAQGPPDARFSTLEKATPVPVTGDGFQAPSSRAGRALGAGGLALVLAALLALALERLDTKVRTKEHAERAFRLPVVAEIPKSKLRGRGAQGISALAQPMTLTAEGYRILRASLLLMPRRVADPDAPGGAWGLPGTRPDGSLEPDDLQGLHDSLVVLVTSPGPGDGKTTTVANLAVTFAETGRSVLVLGADLRRPEIHHHLEVEEGPGLSEVLAGGPSAPALAEVLRMTAVAGVAMVTSGTPAPSHVELFGGRHHLIDDARELADVVLIDTPPLLLTNDAVELASQVDSVVVVCRSGRTSTEASIRASELLARVGAKVTGVALVAPPRTGFSTAYSDGYYLPTEATRFGPLSRRSRQRRSSESEPARNGLIEDPTSVPSTRHGLWVDDGDDEGAGGGRSRSRPGSVPPSTGR